MAGTSGLVPTILLAAVTATSRGRSDSRSRYWAAGSSAVEESASAQRSVAPLRSAAWTQGAAGAARAPPPPAPGPPPRGRGAGEPVGERGHVRPEDHAVGLGAGQVGHGSAALGHDAVRATAGRERAAGVADPGPVGLRDGLDDRRGHLGPGG